MRIKGNCKVFRFLKEGDIISITNMDNGYSACAYFIELKIVNDYIIFRYRYIDKESITRLNFKKSDVDSQFMDRISIRGKSHIISIK